MNVMVMPADNEPKRASLSEQRIQVMVNVQAEVLDPEVARRIANVWLLDNVGNLLGAEKPELILGNELLWRYDVVLGMLSLDEPGNGDHYRVGEICVHAVTGEIQGTDTLADEIQKHAAAAVG